MSIDTGYHPPTKLKTIQNSFTKHPVVDKAVNDMLAANIICPSRSPCSFPIVIGEKRMALRDSVWTL